MNHQDFLDLVAALRGGQPDAVEALLRLYEPYLRRVIRGRLRHSPLARLFDSVDVCQSILKSFLYLAGEGRFCLDSPEKLQALLVTMACNKLRTYARALRHEEGNLPADWDAPDSSPAPLERLADEDLVQQAMALLTSEERELARERFVEGRKWADIGTERGTRADAVRVRLERAMALVREQLASED